MYKEKSNKEKCVKYAERRLRGSSQRYMLKSPDMKLPAVMTSFLKNSSNKEKFVLPYRNSVHLKQSKVERKDNFFL